MRACIFLLHVAALPLLLASHLDTSVARKLATDAAATSQAVTSFDVEGKNVVESLVAEHSACEGKERLLEIVWRAGNDNLTVVDCEALPTWKEVTSLYGDEPVVYGLETCARYRAHVSAQAKDGKIPDPQPKVGGLFNSGTNALSLSFNVNVKRFSNFKEHELPGGKHVPPKKEWFTTFQETAPIRWNILPIILLRDPYRWMQVSNNVRVRS
jgi:hypothetical protein